MIQIEAVVSGHVCAVDVAVGATIAAGDAVMMIESMKMEIPVIATTSGTVQSVHVTEGGVVQEGDVIAVIE